MRHTKTFLLLLAAILFAVPADAQLLRRTGSESRRPGTSREELNARNIISSALEAFGVGQDERGIKALQQVEKQYPTSKARFQACLLLGEHFMAKRRYEEAIEPLDKVLTSEDDTQIAQALCWIGICYYEQNAYDQAVSSLRQVINRFPGTGPCNDAYYYVGLCHYHRRRWGKALQAFELVGSSVADRQDEGETLAEAGRRLFIRVRDKDLPVLSELGEKLLVKVTSASGDEEQVPLEPMGRTREDYVASVRATTETSPPGDGLLRIRGGDTVTVDYVDENTLAGESSIKRVASVRLVSTAGLAITDGAFRQSVGAVAIHQPVFIRLKDLDLDTTEQADEVRAKIVARFQKPEEEELIISSDADDNQAAGGLDLTEKNDEIWVTRGTSYITLRETAPTSGLFTGRVTPRVLASDQEEPTASDELSVRPGDQVQVVYMDKKHLRGEDPIELTADVLIVETGSPQIENMVSVSSNSEIQARKLLLEAQLRQMLAQTFQEMGLLDRATEKSDSGLERVEEILRLQATTPLPQELIERAFEAKWNLLLAQNDVKNAIATCQALLKLYPDTRLADQAFLKIGQAYYDSDIPDEVSKAIPVLQMVMGMEGAAGRAEAAYLLARVYGRQADYAGNGSQQAQLVARSIAQYMQCAEQFPDSPYAAESLKRVIVYYYDQRDFPRASELLERVCQDYQDQDWLHEMVLRWGAVYIRMNNRDAAIEKLHQVIEEYPESESAQKASALLKKLVGE